MLMKIVTMIVFAVLFTGCGGGSSSSSQEKSTAEAENSMYVLDGAVNDIVGLTRWSYIIYNYYYHALGVSNIDKEVVRYTDRVIACPSQGTMKVNGDITINDSNTTYDLDINFNNCEMNGSVLAGLTHENGIVNFDTTYSWRTTYSDFIIGAGLADASHTSGSLASISTLENEYETLNARVFNNKSEVNYSDFKLFLFENNKVITAQINGSFNMIKDEYACTQKTYTVNTFSDLSFESSVPLVLLSGELGINDIGYTFNADRSIDVVDGRTMWTMQVEDYEKATCN